MAQDAQDTQNVPRWFSDFAVKNADEHGQLAAKIEAVRGELRQEMATSRGELREEMSTLRGDFARAETRMTRWFIAALAVGLTIAVTVLTYVN